jgi:hypothetical protein
MMMPSLHLLRRHMELHWLWILAVVFVLLSGCTASPKEVSMADNMLTCALVASANPDGTISLAFNLTNPGSQPIRIQYFEPFVTFDLTLRTPDGPAELIQPGLDLGLQPVQKTIAPGQSLQISTPVGLRFDPSIGPAGGDDPLIWSIRHTPAPLTIEATLRLSEVNIAPCTTTFSPGR